MNTTQLAPYQQSFLTLFPVKSQNKSVISRLHNYEAFVLENSTHLWVMPSLDAYRDWLLAQGLTPTAARAYISSVRSYYNDLLSDNTFREFLYGQLDSGLNVAERKAHIDELITRIENAVSERRGKVQIQVVQDNVDSEFVWLTPEQVRQLILLPDGESLTGMRDRAMLALLSATGIRAAELAALEVSDLRQKMNGQLVLLIRDGKGHKKRAVPYGNRAGALELVEAWLKAAGITSGPVFRGLYKGGISIRSSALTVRAVEQIVGSYTLPGGIRAKAHDLRRTYARNAYLAGENLVAISKNLGHSSIKTTERYIGDLTVDIRAFSGGWLPV